MRRLLAALGPGILVAATGVGAGDLAVASSTGSHLGVAVGWAVLVGAALKWLLNESLARFQLATGDTLLEGAARRLGRPVAWLFLPYLLFWSFFVGGALMSACGATAHALVPVFADPKVAKGVFGALSSLVGLALVWRGGYAVFERVMGVCIALMFVTVVLTAVLLEPPWAEVARGLVVPQIPDAGGEGLGWTVALMGGVGGTVTVLCYGYWIREEGRDSLEALRACRVDLAVGYAMTALFGVAMVVIGSTVPAEGRGAALVVSLAERLEGPLGPAGRWVFLLGAWGAVFSSLLGVWQSVPYLFADALALARGQRRSAQDAVDTEGRVYRAYMVALALVPMLGLVMRFEQVQKLYALVGAAFLPMLALVLLVLTTREAWVGRRGRTGPLGAAALVATLAFFAWIGWQGWG